MPVQCQIDTLWHGMTPATVVKISDLAEILKPSRVHIGGSKIDITQRWHFESRFEFMRIFVRIVEFQLIFEFQLSS